MLNVDIALLNADSVLLNVDIITQLLARSSI